MRCQEDTEGKSQDSQNYGIRLRLKGTTEDQSRLPRTIQYIAKTSKQNNNNNF